MAHLLPERELEAELALVGVEGVEHNTDASRELSLNLGDFGTGNCGVVVSAPHEFDMASGAEHRRG